MMMIMMMMMTIQVIGATVTVMPPLGFAGVCPFAGSTHDDHDDKY